jgi:hypothetical protein
MNANLRRLALSFRVRGKVQQELTANRQTFLALQSASLLGRMTLANALIRM